jgi:simple sugar transport system ATP-binding protein
LRRISKRFGPVQANDEISLALRPGEIHALLGENGAGKTTLLNILSGMIQPDSGEITIDGHPVTLDSPATALRLGIGTVYQHFALVPNFTIAENVMLGHEGSFFLQGEAGAHTLAEMMAEFGLQRSPRTEVRHLALGERQRVELIKVLARGSRVLLLDEPTSILTPHEVEGLFGVLAKLRAQGVAVVLITHKLEEALAISDRVTILRQGHAIAELGPEALTAERGEMTRGRIVELMFGGAAAPEEARGREGQTAHRDTAGPVLLTLDNVNAMGDQERVAVRDLSLEVHAGEVFGIAGVDGNGQKELAEVIAGQRAVTAGDVLLAGEPVTNRGVSAAARAGIGYITDDRMGEGCLAQASVADNAALKMIAQHSRRFWLDRRAMTRQAVQMVEAFNIRTPGVTTRAGLLSGGNIQKLLLARELALDPKVLVCNKPTTGLDLKTAQFVIETLRAQADAGKAVILISPELDELLAISDRIGVMDRGRLTAIVPRAAADAETLGRLILGSSR